MRSKVVPGIYVSNRNDGPLHILTYRKRRAWVCRCLEYDLTAMHESKEIAFAQMKRLICDLFDATGGLLSEAPRPAAPDLWAAWSRLSGEGLPRTPRGQGLN